MSLHATYSPTGARGMSHSGGCANVLMNRTQTRQLFGWSNAEFDAAVARGFPATKPDPSRGRDWPVDSKAAIAWLVEQEAGKVRPRSGAPDEPPPPTPKGLEAVDRLGNPLEAGFLLCHLMTVYALPRWVASFAAAECGLPMDTVYRLANGIAGMVIRGTADELAGALEPWRSAEPPDVYDEAGFAPINWANLSHGTG